MPLAAHPARVLAGAAVIAGLGLAGPPATATATAPAAAPAAGKATSMSATASYTCRNPALSLLPPPLNALGSFTVPASFTVANLPEVLTANVPVPAGVPIAGQLQLPTSGGLGDLLTGLTVTLAHAFEGTPVAPVVVQFDALTSPVVNGLVDLEGSLGSFTPSGAGLPIPIPTSFDADLLTSRLAVLGVSCTLDPGSVAPVVTPVVTPGGGAGGAGGGLVPGPGGVVQVGKQQATVRVSGRKVVKQGRKAVVVVAVKTSSGQPAAGDVVVKTKGAKTTTKTLENGKVRVVLRGLRPGSHQVKVTFLGNDVTDPAKARTTLRVVR